jgi:hypothetical protein
MKVAFAFLIIGFVLGYSLRAAISQFRRTRARRIAALEQSHPVVLGHQ